MSPFIGNQDVPRFISRAAGMIASDASGQAWSAPPPAPTTDDPYDKTFLALTFVLTQPGVPLIYYGDEIGTPGTADPDNRRMMKWSGLSPREQGLLDRVKIVSKARGTHPGLMRGARRTLYTDGDGYVYARGGALDVAVVALNRGSTNRSVHVILPPELGVPDGTVLRDLLGGPSVTATAGALDVPLTIRGAQLFVR
jgi:neopullulanase